MTAPVAPKLLFVPVSGASGAGEYFRSLAIARGAQQTWPLAQIHFIVNRSAGFAADVPFPTSLIDGSPTQNTPAVNQLLTELRPDVVIFDSAGREAQLRQARKLGARTVYVSSRFKTRWKGFRLRRMLQLDQHWLAWPQPLGGALTLWERLKLALLQRPEIVYLDCVYPALDRTRAAALFERLQLPPSGYLFFCAGGGGYVRGPPAAEIFRSAALSVSRRLGTPAVCVMGPNYRGPPLNDPALIELGAVDNVMMTDLLWGARLAVINGGSLLLQALALHTACLAVPIAGDQDRRIELCRRRGAAAAAALHSETISAATLALARDPQQLEALRAGARSLALRDGLREALNAIARLLRLKSPD